MPDGSSALEEPTLRRWFCIARSLARLFDAIHGATSGAVFSVGGDTSGSQGISGTSDQLGLAGHYLQLVLRRGHQTGNDQLPAPAPGEGWPFLRGHLRADQRLAMLLR